MGITRHPKKQVEAAILILESSPKTARQRCAVFGLQSGEFAPFGRELSALKLILRIAEVEVRTHLDLGFRIDSK